MEVIVVTSTWWVIYSTLCSSVAYTPYSMSLNCKAMDIACSMRTNSVMPTAFFVSNIQIQMMIFATLFFLSISWWLCLKWSAESSLLSISVFHSYLSVFWQHYFCSSSFSFWDMLRFCKPWFGVSSLLNFLIAQIMSIFLFNSLFHMSPRL